MGRGPEPTSQRVIAPGAASTSTEGGKMLVLTRKIGERVVIESGIHLTVLAVEGRRVCLGIDAPDSVSILRSELVDGRLPRRPCAVAALGRRQSGRVALERWGA